MPWILTFRQLIRAEQHRREVFTQGRPPEFLSRPEGAVKLLLEAAAFARDGALQDAGRLLDQAEQARPRLKGTCDGVSFEDFRDLDDQVSCILEVLTTQGNYYWIPIDQIESIEFHKPVRSRDLLWRCTHLIVRDGPDGEVYVPVLYPGAAEEPEDDIRLGRRTDWRGGDEISVQGVGQRHVLSRRRRPSDPRSDDRHLRARIQELSIPTMAEIRTDLLLLPSVLDRLIDNDPQVHLEASASRNQLLRDLKQAVRRDLENLLNTRIRCIPWSAELPELKQSVVNYGIPDLTGTPLASSREREEFRRTIQSVILLYEPRLKKLKVTLGDQADAIDRTIRFRIEAILQAEPAPEPVAFDSALRLTTGSFEVKGQSDAG